MKNAPLAENLLREAHRFDFFQAVRVLERMAAEQAASGERRHPVGEDFAPRQEAVRFRVAAFAEFSRRRDRRNLSLRRRKSRVPNPTPPEMVVAFLGLTGPNGVLPRHYTSLLIERVRAKDYALRDLLDLFHHRIISLFYRAWEKYRFPIAYERLAREERSAKEDLFTDCLYCLLGIGHEQAPRSDEFRRRGVPLLRRIFRPLPAKCHFAWKACWPIISSRPVRVLQFHGQWLYLSRDDQSALPTAELPEGLNCQLGRNVIVGERVWDIEGKFRVRLGPLGIEDFRRFMPDGDALLPLEPDDPRVRRSAIRFRRSTGAQGRRSALVPIGRRRSLARPARLEHLGPLPGISTMLTMRFLA